MARDPGRRVRVRRMLERAPWWRRLEARIVLSSMLLGTVCVGAAYLLITRIAAYYELRGDAQVTVALGAIDTARPFYGEVVAAKREAFAARTELLEARSAGAAMGGDEALRGEFERALSTHPDLLSLRRGKVEVSRSIPADEGADEGAGEGREGPAGTAPDRWIRVETRAGPPGDELVAEFGVDPEFDRRYQALADAERDMSLESLGDGTVASREEVDRAISRLIAVASGVVLLAAFIVGFVLARTTTRKLSDISDVMRRVAGGDARARAPALGPDELGLLAGDLNSMLDRLDRAQSKVAYLQRIGAWQEMARRIAHEIKNPLTPIQLAVQQLREKDPGQDPRFSALLRDSVEIVEDEVEALRRMVTSFSQFARVPEVAAAPLDLAQLLREFERAYGHLGEHPDDRLEIVSPPGFDGSGAHRVLGDRQLLKQALVNLVENARLSATEHGVSAVVVRIALRVVPGAVLLTVEDNGPGIDAARRERVFEPYETTRAHGTGLGLAIVKKVILDHGGEISAGESEALGGAALTIRLPLAPG